MFARHTVTAVEPLTDDAVALTLDGHRPFAAGQHLTLRRPGTELRRTYSLCSAQGGALRIAVKRVEGGAFSTWVTTQLRVGDVLDVDGPGGSFGSSLAGRGRLGLVAAGSGITPVLSLALTALEQGREVALIFGNSTTRDVMFLDELADLKDRHPERLQLLHVLSREEQVSPLLSGRLDTDRTTRIVQALLPDDVTEWFVCGPFGMVTDVRAALQSCSKAPVHVELFHAEKAPSEGARARIRPAGTGRSEVTVELNGRRSVLTVDPAGAPVLDVVLAVRADAPYACKGGVCGTCRARVVSGAVEMDVNYALEPDELAAGIVLTCQAHPTTPTVELQYL